MLGRAPDDLAHRVRSGRRDRDQAETPLASGGAHQRRGGLNRQSRRARRSKRLWRWRTAEPRPPSNGQPGSDNALRVRSCLSCTTAHNSMSAMFTVDTSALTHSDLGFDREPRRPLSGSLTYRRRFHSRNPPRTEAAEPQPQQYEPGRQKQSEFRPMAPTDRPIVNGLNHVRPEGTRCGASVPSPPGHKEPREAVRSIRPMIRRPCSAPTLEETGVASPPSRAAS
jgi:hypothetical protein